MTIRHLTAFIFVGLVGCSSSHEPNLQQQFEDADQRLELLGNLKKEPQSVLFKKQLYVPPLQQGTATLPAWSAQPVSITAQGLAAGTLLSKALESEGVVPYFDNEKL